MRDQKAIFNKFKDCIKKDPDNMKPIYKEEAQVKKRYFEKPEDVEQFWRSLWQAEDSGNLAATWLDEIRIKMAEIVPDPHEGDLEITSSDCYRAVGKKKNWSAPGPDKIANYWWKKITSILPPVTSIFRDIINFELNIKRWYCGGRT